jgi:peptidyl-prolyl cis-trans isomerase SurA
MKHRVALAAGLILLAWPAFAQVLVDQIVAKVNDDIILSSYLTEQRRYLQQEAQNFLAQGRPAQEVQAALDDELDNLLRNLIDESLLVQKASEYGIDSDASLQVLRTFDQIREDNGFDTVEDLEAAIIAQGDSPESFRDGIRKQYLREQVLSQDVRSRIVVTTEELRTYYDAHRADFDRPSGINIAEIVKVVGELPEDEAAQVRADMEAIHARLVDGEDFFEIAREESESSTAPDGGILGYFGDGMLGPEFERASAGLARNEISDIFEVQGALVIIKLLERHAGGVLSFDSARKELESIVMRDKEGPRIREYLSRLRRDGFVWVREGYVDTGAVDSPDSAGVE